METNHLPSASSLGDSPSSNSSSRLASSLDLATNFEKELLPELTEYAGPVINQRNRHKVIGRALIVACLVSFIVQSQGTLLIFYTDARKGYPFWLIHFRPIPILSTVTSFVQTKFAFKKPYFILYVVHTRNFYFIFFRSPYKT
jgi:hypothetical protein